MQTFWLYIKPFQALKGEAIINCKSAREEVKQANQKVNSRKQRNIVSMSTAIRWEHNYKNILMQDYANVIKYPSFMKAAGHSDETLVNIGALWLRGTRRVFIRLGTDQTVKWDELSLPPSLTHTHRSCRSYKAASPSRLSARDWAHASSRWLW